MARIDWFDDDDRAAAIAATGTFVLMTMAMMLHSGYSRESGIKCLPLVARAAVGAIYALVGCFGVRLSELQNVLRAERNLKESLRTTSPTSISERAVLFNEHIRNCSIMYLLMRHRKDRKTRKHSTKKNTHTNQ